MSFKGSGHLKIILIVVHDGFWIWTGSTTGKEMAKCKIPRCRKEEQVARLILAAKLGRPIKANHEVMHSCDVRRCVDPEHV